MQEVLHADWQEAWHSPQPPFTALSFKLALFRVFMCFTVDSLLFVSIIIPRPEMWVQLLDSKGGGLDVAAQMGPCQHLRCRNEFST